MNRVNFMLYFNYFSESQFTLAHVLCQCCLNFTLRFSVVNAEYTRYYYIHFAVGL